MDYFTRSATNSHTDSCLEGGANTLMSIREELLSLEAAQEELEINSNQQEARQNDFTNHKLQVPM